MRRVKLKYYTVWKSSKSNVWAIKQAAYVELLFDIWCTTNFKCICCAATFYAWLDSINDIDHCRMYTYTFNIIVSCFRQTLNHQFLENISVLPVFYPWVQTTRSNLCCHMTSIQLWSLCTPLTKYLYPTTPRSFFFFPRPTIQMVGQKRLILF